MTTDTEAGDGAQDYSSAESWQTLDAEEQDRVLTERLEEEQGLGTGSFDSLDEGEQASAIERLEGKLEETWQAIILEDVVVECFELSEAQMDEVFDKARVMFEVADTEAEDADDIDPDLLDSLDEVNEWLNEFLADITEEDEMSQDYWEDGSRYPKGTRLELFLEVFNKYSQDMEATQSFRTE